MKMSALHEWFASALVWCSGLLRADAPKLVRILVISDGLEYTSEQQFAPITRYHGLLRKHFGHVFRYRYLDEVLSKPHRDFRGYGAVIFKVSYLETAERAANIVTSLRQRAGKLGLPLICFDGNDDQCVQWPKHLELSDVYVKKHVFSDRLKYTQPYVGRSNLTDYAAKQFGSDFSKDHVSVARALPQSQLHKMMPGWNIGLDDKIVELAANLPSIERVSARDIDVMCRASNSKPGTLLHAMRSPAVQAIQALKNPIKALAPTKQVDQQTYYQEMLSSKMCVCPFGFGELCWRDFEAALCGCLILKPSMDHVESAPNIFIPFETYVPLKWDYSDLHEKVAYYLAHPQEMDRIAKAARHALLKTLTPEWFVQRYEQVVMKNLFNRRDQLNA